MADQPFAPSDLWYSSPFPFLLSRLTLPSPAYAPFFSALGCISAIVLTSFGAAYGTAKSSLGTFSAGIIHPSLGVRALLPTVFSGILAIYGLVTAVLLANHIQLELPLYTALVNLGSGLSVGLCGLAAGFAIGIVGDVGIRGTAMQPRLFVRLYGLIVALITDTRANLVSSKICYAQF
ncbi:hypothetical protein PRZ48_012974 [Zasmidium cellare]|uniref:V-type proton ATPase proteolipid subunit n=1 Tax=Zasmidium cellare TaxID=395010 RepID=A0ABR0E2R0_ZASCE|nr:hypothetical protein PRZ48_012974 [Zasmidium cellare]